ncbi:hypothetical protein Fot_02463 [Forsythia ovata]|uniref:Cyclic nucleotide-binding domain-containing protein n=1 Tax=Forsythia ovata TaxID=205694 RepID=A0ABD1X6Y4_9LAMI
MVDIGDSDLEEIGGNAPRKIVVMAEPVRAICSISKLDFNANYFKILRKKHLEQLYGVINLSDSDSEAEMIHLMMAKLIAKEATDLQKQREESLTQQKVKWVAGPSDAVESSGDGEFISPRTYRVTLGWPPRRWTG